MRLIENAILVSVLTSMVLVATYQVIARNFFDTGLLWGDALVRVLVLWVALVGAGRFFSLALLVRSTRRRS